MTEGGVVARLGAGVVAGLAAAVVCVVLLVWAAQYVLAGWSLYQLEQEDPVTLEPQTGEVRQRVGPLGLDEVTVPQEGLEGGRTLLLYRQGEPRRLWPRPEVLVGEHGARYADEPPLNRAWLPFLLVALGAVAAGAAAGWTSLRLLPWSYRQAAVTIFGQRALGSKDVTWIPGGGGHGSGGGQVPPHVPYNPDWDPKNRIR